MAQISVRHLTFYYDGSFDHIFEDVSFSIDTSWKLGFLGRNGKGKTTFLQLLLGKYTYQGTIDSPAGFAYFPYPVTAEQSQQPASAWISEIRAGCEEWQVICELSLLNETADILYRPFCTLSPGEQTKILLAILFSGEERFLLVDEPTNHLDQEARDTVRHYLAAKKGFILVSHDRDLLDACTDHVLVLNRKTITVQSGNFSVWWEEKERKDRFAAAENEKHRKEIRKLRQAARRTAEWADKSERSKIGFDPVKEHDRCISTRAYLGAKTKKMQSRVKQMEQRIGREIEETEGLLQDIEETADLKLTPLKHHRQVLLHFREYALQYPDAAQPVFSGLTADLKQGDRIALHGANGCGKSTLIRKILQKCGIEGNAPDIQESGICELASGMIVSYIPQNTAWLHGTAVEFCAQRGLDLSMFCTLLRRLDFERSQLFKNMADFSEGQKKKVLIAAALLTPAHLCLWDEPLNYIDVFSRMQIERLLHTFQPTMLFVEHDVRFREAIATGCWELNSP